jgi:ubiquinone/menaquinone biosynthesis C-methylase UbiE
MEATITARNHQAVAPISYPKHKRRDLELELMLQLGKIKPNLNILDVGCGAAYQCAVLRDRGYNVTCVDIVDNATYTYLDRLCDCCHLPFEDNSFDIIYSSHLLEHIKDKNQALREMVRVLSPDGFIHVIVPTSTWKICQLLIYYPELLSRFVKWFLKKRGSKRENRDTDTKKVTPETGSKLERLYFKAKRAVFPEVHGTAPSNLEELREFRVSSWLGLFKNNGLNVNKIVMGPFYMPDPFPFPTIKATGIKLHSSVIFNLSYQKT